MAVIGLTLLVGAHALDYVSFLVMVAMHGISAEANPFVTQLASHGLSVLTMAKAAAVLLAVCTVVILRGPRPWVAGAVLVVGILAGAVGAVSNIATIDGWQ